MAGNLNAILNGVGTRLYTLIACRDLCSISGNHPESPRNPQQRFTRTRTHAARDNSHISLARTNRTLSRNEHVLAEVRLACYIVVVAVDALHFRGKCRHKFATAHRAHDLAHHQIAIGASEILRPLNRFDVVVEVLRVLWEVREITIRQSNKESLHVLLGQLNEVRTHPVAHASRPAVKHEPNHLALIKAYLDEVVSRSERPKVVRMISAIKLWVLRQDCVIARL